MLQQIKLRNEKKDIYVLNLHGGGVKGCVQLGYLKYLQKILNDNNSNIVDFFDLIVGTSVGSIVGGGLAYGIFPNKLQNIFLDIIPKIFKKRLRIPRYDRKILKNEFLSNIGDPKLYMLPTNFVATAVDVVDDRTHYFKSWEDRDSEMSLLDTILCSSAAPYYFGKYIDESGMVWLDGGVGMNNNPILVTLTECFRQNWINSEHTVNIISIGTGFAPENIKPYSVKNWTFVDELLYYANIFNGGRARTQLSFEIESYIKAMRIPNLNLYSINAPMDKKYNILDGVKYMNYYNEFGLNLEYTLESDMLTNQIEKTLKL